jgi:hypothetical protein
VRDAHVQVHRHKEDGSCRGLSARCSWLMASASTSEVLPARGKAAREREKVGRLEIDKLG